MIILYVILLLLTIGEGAFPCIPRDFGNGGTVCVCNSSYCDTVDPISPSSPGNYVLYTSSKDGLRFERSYGALRLDDQNFTDCIQLVVEANLKYQKIIGFGGAFTDAAGINIKSLSSAAQELLMRSYFSSLGNEYNIGRVPLAGSDFSTRTYSYDDIPGDISLSHFNLTQEDYLLKIPLIRRAIELSNGNLILIGSAWTAPPWMKTNNDYSGFGFLKREFFQLWAEYHIKFLDAYKDLGIEFWALTTGNEPTNGIIPINRFNSMGWSPTEMREWIAENIGPTIAESKHKETKLIMLDDQRFLLPWWVNIVLKDPKANKFIDGIGVHWYWDWLFPVRSLDRTHEAHPDKFILATEACIGDKPWEQQVLIGSWSRGEAYMTDILEDLQHWVVGWVDWNLALNTEGGPNWAKNFVDSAILVNATADEFYKQPMYYALGHFSKFLPWGSQRVGLTSAGGFNQVNGVAFERPDGKNVVILHNRSDKPFKVIVSDKRHGHMILKMPPRSFHSLLYE